MQQTMHLYLHYSELAAKKFHHFVNDKTKAMRAAIYSSMIKCRGFKIKHLQIEPFGKTLKPCG